MIIPGGMIAPPTSSALSVRFTFCAGRIMPSTSARTVRNATDASCGRVTFQRTPSPCPPWPEPECPDGAALTLIRPCFMFRETIQTLTGYAVVKPTITPSDMTAQKSGSVGCMARMSRPIISRAIVGNIPAAIMFIESHSGTKVALIAPKYEPPSMSFMNSDWKMKRPNAKPAAYSTMKSIHIGRPRAAVIAAAAMIPVASPAMQWTVEPMPCFQSGRMNSAWVPGSGSLSVRT